MPLAPLPVDDGEWFFGGETIRIADDTLAAVVDELGEMGDTDCCSFSLRIDWRIDCDWKCVIELLNERKSNGVCAAAAAAAAAFAPSNDETAFVCWVSAAYCAAAHINWPG